MFVRFFLWFLLLLSPYGGLGAGATTSPAESPAPPEGQAEPSDRRIDDDDLLLEAARIAFSTLSFEASELFDGGASAAVVASGSSTANDERASTRRRDQQRVDYFAQHVVRQLAEAAPRGSSESEDDPYDGEVVELLPDESDSSGVSPTSTRKTGSGPDPVFRVDVDSPSRSVDVVQDDVHVAGGRNMDTTTPEGYPRTVGEQEAVPSAEPSRAGAGAVLIGSSVIETAAGALDTAPAPAPNPPSSSSGFTSFLPNLPSTTASAAPELPHCQAGVLSATSGPTASTSSTQQHNKPRRRRPASQVSIVPQTSTAPAAAARNFFQNAEVYASVPTHNKHYLVRAVAGHRDISRLLFIGGTSLVAANAAAVASMEGTALALALGTPAGGAAGTMAGLAYLWRRWGHAQQALDGAFENEEEFQNARKSRTQKLEEVVAGGVLAAKFLKAAAAEQNGESGREVADNFLPSCGGDHASHLWHVMDRSSRGAKSARSAAGGRGAGRDVRASFSGAELCQPEPIDALAASLVVTAYLIEDAVLRDTEGNVLPDSRDESMPLALTKACSVVSGIVLDRRGRGEEDSSVERTLVERSLDGGVLLEQMNKEDAEVVVFNPLDEVPAFQKTSVRSVLRDTQHAADSVEEPWRTSSSINVDLLVFHSGNEDWFLSRTSSSGSGQKTTWYLALRGTHTVVDGIVDSNVQATSRALFSRRYHNGFYNRLEKTVSQLFGRNLNLFFQVLARTAGSFVVTGHSLAGAVSLVFHSELRAARRLALDLLFQEKLLLRAGILPDRKDDVWRPAAMSVSRRRVQVKLSSGLVQMLRAAGDEQQESTIDASRRFEAVVRVGGGSGASSDSEFDHDVAAELLQWVKFQLVKSGVCWEVVQTVLGGGENTTQLAAGELMFEENFFMRRGHVVQEYELVLQPKTSWLASYMGGGASKKKAFAAERSSKVVQACGGCAVGYVFSELPLFARIILKQDGHLRNVLFDPSFFDVRRARISALFLRNYFLPLWKDIFWSETDITGIRGGKALQEAWQVVVGGPRAPAPPLCDRTQVIGFAGPSYYSRDALMHEPRSEGDQEEEIRMTAFERADEEERRSRPDHGHGWIDCLWAKRLSTKGIRPARNYVYEDDPVPRIGEYNSLGAGASNWGTNLPVLGDFFAFSGLMYRGDEDIVLLRVDTSTPGGAHRRALMDMNNPSAVEGVDVGYPELMWADVAPDVLRSRMRAVRIPGILMKRGGAENVLTQYMDMYDIVSNRSGGRLKADFGRVGNWHSSNNYKRALHVLVAGAGAQDAGGSAAPGVASDARTAFLSTQQVDPTLRSRVRQLLRKTRNELLDQSQWRVTQVTVFVRDVNRFEKGDIVMRRSAGLAAWDEPGTVKAVRKKINLITAKSEKLADVEVRTGTVDLRTGVATTGSGRDETVVLTVPLEDLQHWLRKSDEVKFAFTEACGVAVQELDAAGVVVPVLRQDEGGDDAKDATMTFAKQLKIFQAGELQRTVSFSVDRVDSEFGGDGRLFGVATVSRTRGGSGGSFTQQFATPLECLARADAHAVSSIEWLAMQGLWSAHYALGLILEHKGTGERWHGKLHRVDPKQRVDDGANLLDVAAAGALDAAKQAAVDAAEMAKQAAGNCNTAAPRVVVDFYHPTHDQQSAARLYVYSYMAPDVRVDHDRELAEEFLEDGQERRMSSNSQTVVKQYTSVSLESLDTKGAWRAAWSTFKPVWTWRDRSLLSGGGSASGAASAGAASAVGPAHAEGGEERTGGGASEQDLQQTASPIIPPQLQSVLGKKPAIQQLHDFVRAENLRPYNLRSDNCKTLVFNFLRHFGFDIERSRPFGVAVLGTSAVPWDPVKLYEHSLSVAETTKANIYKSLFGTVRSWADPGRGNNLKLFLTATEAVAFSTSPDIPENVMQFVRGEALWQAGLGGERFAVLGADWKRVTSGAGGVGGG